MLATPTTPDRNTAENRQQTGLALAPLMTQAEIVRSMLIECGDLVVEAVRAGDQQEADRLLRRRDSLLTHLGALDAEDNLRAA